MVSVLWSGMGSVSVGIDVCWVSQAKILLHNNFTLLYRNFLQEYSGLAAISYCQNTTSSLVCFLFALFCIFALAMIIIVTVYWPLMWPITCDGNFLFWCSYAPFMCICVLSPWLGLILTSGPQVTPASTGSGSFLEFLCFTQNWKFILFRDLTL